MQMTLKYKFVGTLLGSLIICCGVILFISIYLMKLPLENELDKGISRIQNVILEVNKMTFSRFKQSASLIAIDENLVRAIVEKKSSAG